MLWMGPPPKLLSANDLEVGDVVFCGSANTDKATSLIQNLTDGSYVHCGIYIGNNKIIDIATSGARCVTVNNFIHEYSYLAISRCPGMNHHRKRAIVRYAKLCVNKLVKYNWLGAAVLPINEYLYITSQYRMAFGKKFRPPRLSKKYFTKNRMFCSEFVVQCFKACGYIMKDDPYSISQKCSPTWLAEENTFSLIGYMSVSGLKCVDKNDPFLGGCGYILSKT